MCLATLASPCEGPVARRAQWGPPCGTLSPETGREGNTMAQTEIPEIPENFADQRLVEVLVRHHGVVDASQLQAAGYFPAEIRHLLADRVLVPAETGSYVFPDPALYIDMLVLVQWRPPEGIFVGRTHPGFHHLSAVLPVQFPVCITAHLHRHLLGAVPPEVA